MDQGRTTYSTFPQVAGELVRVLDDCDVQLPSIAEIRAGEPRAPGKWSRKEILGHLIDSASNNHQRFVRAAQGRGGEFPGYDPEYCVKIQRTRELAWTVIVNLWSNYNRFLAHVLRGLPAEATGYRVRVSDYPPTTLLWIAGDYVEHMKHHLNQILGDRFACNYPDARPITVA